MSLSTTGYADLLYSKLHVKYPNGYKLREFCDAVGFGVVTETVSLTGIILSPSESPSSSGVGIVSFSATNIATLIDNKCFDLWKSRGPELYTFCLAIGETTVEHFALANLTSDTNGTATFPAFSGAIGAMANLIEEFPEWAGRSFWIRMCTAIAYGICTEVAANGTGTLTGATLPPPGGGVVAIS
jgi:hypothetical protein